MVEEVDAFFPPPKPIFGKVQSQKVDKQLNILVREGPPPRGVLSFVLCLQTRCPAGVGTAVLLVWDTMYGVDTLDAPTIPTL